LIEGDVALHCSSAARNESNSYVPFIQSPVGGLAAGDSYAFRIRADRVDGTVSDYVSTSILVPFGPSPTVDATSETNVDGGQNLILLNVTPPGGVDLSNVSSYEVQAAGTQYVGHGWRDVSAVGSDGDGNDYYNIGDGNIGQFRVRAAFTSGGVSDWAYSGQVLQEPDETAFDDINNSDTVQDPYPTLSL
jgi:hypothetical protein